MASLRTDGISTVSEELVRQTSEINPSKGFSFQGREAQKIWNRNSTAVIASRRIALNLTQTAVQRFKSQGETVKLGLVAGETEEVQLLLSLDGTKENIVRLVVKQGDEGSSLELTEGKISPFYPLDSQRTANPQEADIMAIDQKGDSFLFNFRTMAARLLGETTGLFPSPEFTRTNRSFFLSHDLCRFQNSEKDLDKLKGQLLDLLNQIEQTLANEKLDGKSNLLSYSVTKQGGDQRIEESELPKPKPRKVTNSGQTIPVTVEIR